MTKLEFRVPESMLVSTPLEKGKITLIGFPDRKVHRSERPRCVWFECRSQGYGFRLWVDGKILFHSTREDMAEDGLVLAQEILRSNPGTGLESIWIGARNALISQTLFLRPHLKIREDKHFNYRRGRGILKLVDAKKAFADLEKVREESKIIYRFSP
jgi:hypothetical protein